MAITGTKGKVTLGTEELEGVTNWSLDINAEPIETTHMDPDHDGWREYMPGDLKDWTGSIVLEGDSDVEVTENDAVSLELENPKRTYTGDAIIQSVSEPVAIGEKVVRTATFRGTGELTKTATSP